MPVLVRGTGIAARCCARLLHAQGMGVSLDAPARPTAPVVMLSNSALALMRDCLGDAALLSGHRRVTRRVVSWGGRDPVAMDHAAIILQEGELDDLLFLDVSPAPPPAAPDMTILAAPPFPSGAMRRFGTRKSETAQVSLRYGDDDQACWIEAVETGWLFLIPSGETRGWLLAVGGSVPELLAQSRHIAARVDVTDVPPHRFETAPGLIDRLAAPGWLACGTAALAFDPICGDGTAQAAREAVLAVAVTRAIADGGDAEALTAHYHAMLLAAMRRHLKLCAGFYSSGGTDAWWQAQMAALADGFEWCTAQLSTLPEPRFKLHGLQLVERRVAA